MTEPWLMRLIAERDELEARLAKLSAFIESGGADDTGTESARLLRVQELVMKQYLDILDARIALAKA